MLMFSILSSSEPPSTLNEEEENSLVELIEPHVSELPSYVVAQLEELQREYDNGMDSKSLPHLNACFHFHSVLYFIFVYSNIVFHLTCAMSYHFRFFRKKLSHVVVFWL